VSADAAGISADAQATAVAAARAAALAAGMEYLPPYGQPLQQQQQQPQEEQPPSAEPAEQQGPTQQQQQQQQVRRKVVRSRLARETPAVLESSRESIWTLPIRAGALKAAFCRREAGTTHVAAADAALKFMTSEFPGPEGTWDGINVSQVATKLKRMREAAAAAANAANAAAGSKQNPEQNATTCSAAGMQGEKATAVGQAIISVATSVQAFTAREKADACKKERQRRYTSQAGKKDTAVAKARDFAEMHPRNSAVVFFISGREPDGCNALVGETFGPELCHDAAYNIMKQGVERSMREIRDLAARGKLPRSNDEPGKARHKHVSEKYVRSACFFLYVAKNRLGVRQQLLAASGGTLLESVVMDRLTACWEAETQQVKDLYKSMWRADQDLQQGNTLKFEHSIMIAAYLRSSASNLQDPDCSL